ncbi:hypothetical protein SNOUR_42810 [Streptomyces noursei ATCC 11455]|nr:hypothetical protein SNOUR_42810 [Streptomyces noursei ATCC 11455]
MRHWNVTIPTSLPDGTRGIHIFVVEAEEERTAQETALKQAVEAHATYHRRGAIIFRDKVH